MAYGNRPLRSGIDVSLPVRLLSRELPSRPNVFNRTLW